MKHEFHHTALSVNSRWRFAVVRLGGAIHSRQKCVQLTRFARHWLLPPHARVGGTQKRFNRGLDRPLERRHIHRLAHTPSMPNSTGARQASGCIFGSSSSTESNMSETARSKESNGDGAYADAYADEDDFSETPRAMRVAQDDGDDDEDEDDANELAEMFAKVQTIQQEEGMLPVSAVRVHPHSHGQPEFEKLEVTIPGRSTKPRTGNSTCSSSSSVCSRSISPSSSTLGRTRSPDGITTLSRKALAGDTHHVLAGIKKPALYQEKLLQTVKQQPQTLEQLKQKVVVSAPATIAKRVESLAAPKKADPGRKFALDDDEKHCRFRIKKKKQGGSGRDAYDDDEAGGGNRTADFIARMEAAERNRQKKLELTRGEKEYLANLSKKVCPKCDVPQSYSEFRDKKKRCQTCGSEFRVPQAWGDIGHEFISRISEDSKLRDDRKDLIRAQVVHAESNSGRVAKSATQQYYEKALQQRNEHKNFLDRNYTAVSNTTSSNSKTRQAQLQLQLQLQAQRAKLLQAAQPPIY